MSIETRGGGEQTNFDWLDDVHEDDVEQFLGCVIALDEERTHDVEQETQNFVVVLSAATNYEVDGTDALRLCMEISEPT